MQCSYTFLFSGGLIVCEALFRGPINTKREWMVNEAPPPPPPPPTSLCVCLSLFTLSCVQRLFIRFILFCHGLPDIYSQRKKRRAFILRNWSVLPWPDDAKFCVFLFERVRSQGMTYLLSAIRHIYPSNTWIWKILSVARIIHWHHLIAILNTLEDYNGGNGSSSSNMHNCSLRKQRKIWLDAGNIFLWSRIINKNIQWGA